MLLFQRTRRLIGNVCCTLSRSGVGKVKLDWCLFCVSPKLYRCRLKSCLGNCHRAVAAMGVEQWAL